MRFVSYIWSLALALIFTLSLVTNWYDTLVYCVSIVTFLMVIDKLGKGIVLREIIALHTTFICLLMPLAGYLVYNTTNALAILWVRYMPVSKDIYFSYCLPAVTAFCLLLCWPISNEKAADTGVFLKKTVEQIRHKLRGNQKIGFWLIAIGLMVFFVIPYLPAGLQYIFNLLYFASFTGLLYIYLSGRFIYKTIILVLFGLFTIVIALRSGMFTIIAYMGMTLFSFFFIGKKVSLVRKTVTFFAAFLVLAIIQSVKPTYRKMIALNPGLNKAEVFADLTMEQLSGKNNFFSANSYFFLYYRANQGFNIALVMRRYPRMVPFDGGSYLLVKIAAAFVPRVLWPDKPEAGGIANMKYYTNITIKNWSTNVGPLSEAYASFGITGGIIYMMLLGAFIRFVYKRVFVVAKKIPLIILWIPVMFYQVTYSAENDTLQILNSLIKSSFFIFILYKAIPRLFKPVDRHATDTGNMPAKLVDRLQTS